jgi:hypothetical protein
MALLKHHPKAIVQKNLYVTEYPRTAPNVVVQIAGHATLLVLELTDERGKVLRQRVLKTQHYRQQTMVHPAYLLYSLLRRGELELLVVAGHLLVVDNIEI